MESENFDYETWLQRYEAGDEQAASVLVHVFYGRLVGLARKRLAGMPPQVADDEGAVISALRSFFSGIDDGQFPDIDDENDLWRVLATITARKAIRQLRVHWKQSGEASRIDRGQELAQLMSRTPSPDEETILVEQCETCLLSLDDPNLRLIARLRLEGCDNREIADRLSIHVRSVQRKLNLIQSIWLENLAE